MNIERLEPRTLFTAVLPFTFVQTGAALKITGADTSVGDQIQLTQNGNIITATDIKTGASISSSGTVSTIVVDLRAGDDYLRERNNDGTKQVLINTTIFGGLGNDTIYGGGVNDNLSGGDGNDKLVGMGGSDGFDGGTGFDTVDYSYESRGLYIDLTVGGNDGVKNVGTGNGELDDIQTNVEAIVGGTGNDVIIGSLRAEWIDGNAGNDTIVGGNGNDTLTGGIGADIVYGQGGTDAGFIKDGTIDSVGDTFETAQVDSKAAGAKVSDITTNAAAPIAGAVNAAFARAFGLSPAFSQNPAPSGGNAVTPDITFGGVFTGVSTQDPLNGVNFAQLSVAKVLLQPGQVTSFAVDENGVSTDKILIVGTINDPNTSTFNDFFVMRLNADGTLDTSFGGAGTGYTTIDFGALHTVTTNDNDVATGAAVDEFGNIIVSGNSYNPDTGTTDIAIAKLDWYGSLDTYFGATDPNAEVGGHFGRNIYNIPDPSDSSGSTMTDDSSAGVVIQHIDFGDGFFVDKYVVAATATSDLQRAAIVRFDENGQVDPNDAYDPSNPYAHFDKVDDSGASTVAAGIVQDDDGLLYVAVNRSDSGDGIFGAGVNAYYSDGFLADSQFFNNNSTANAITVKGDRVIVAGRDNGASVYGDGFVGEIDVFRGEGVNLDVGPSFSNDFGTMANYNDVRIDDAGRVIVAGTVGDPNPFFTSADYVVARYDTELVPDDSFNSGAFFTQIDVKNNISDDGRSMLIQDDGKIVVAGTSVNGNEPASIGVIRFLGLDHTADTVLPDDLTPTDAQQQLQWLNPDTGEYENIPLELFDLALLPTSPQPLVINGTNSDDYISVTPTLGIDNSVDPDKLVPVFNVNINGTIRSYDRRFVSEVDINTHGGTDVVQINDVLYSEPITPDGFQERLAVNIVGGQNHLQVIAGVSTESDGRLVTNMYDVDSGGLGAISQLDDNPHTPGPNDPLVDDEGNPTTGGPADPVYVWTAGDQAGSGRIGYTTDYEWDIPYEYYSDDGYLDITLVQTNSPPVAVDDALPGDVPGDQPFIIANADINSLLLYNDVAGPPSEQGTQTISLVGVFNADHVVGQDGDGKDIFEVNGGTVALNEFGDIVFTPTAGYSGPASFTYQIADDGMSDDGTGNFFTDRLSALGTVSFNIAAPANSAPTDVNLDATSVAENAPVGTVVGTFTTTDSDANDTFTYELVDDAAPFTIKPLFVPTNDNSFFTIDGDQLKTNATFDYETKSSYSVHVRATDNGGKSVDKTITINISNENDAPTDLTVSPASIDENAAANTVVGTFASTDQDAGDSFTYSFVTTGVGPYDNSLFSITNLNGVGTLKANGPFNYEVKNSYTIRVRTTDAAGQSFDKTLTIGVNNVNEKPTASAGGPYTVTQGGSVQLSGSGIDPDANTTLTYAWDVDGDNIFGNSVLLTGASPAFSPAGAGGTSQTVMMRVSDGVLTDISTATINITTPVVSQKLYGTIINGKTGSGNTPDKAADGNPNTFNESTTPPIIDYGSPQAFTKITFLPRINMGWKMIGGSFQASNDKSFKTGVVTLYTVPFALPGVPNSGMTVDVNPPGTYRYVRWISLFAYQNSVAEFTAYGSPGGAVDHTAPSKPGTPHATGQSYTSISMAWNPAYDYGGVDHYDIYRGSTKIGTTSDLFFTDTGAIGGPLKAGTAYTYTIKAFDAAGNSATSSAASLKTLADKVKPSQPTNLHVVSGSLAKTTVTVAWNASTDDIAVIGYYIFRNGSKIGTTSSLTFNSTGLKSKTKYTYTVQAYDSAGNVSLLSTALVVTTL